MITGCKPKVGGTMKQALNRTKLAAVLLAVCLCLLPACSFGQTTEDDGFSFDPSVEPFTLEEIDAVNTADAILKQHGSYSINTITYAPDGSGVSGSKFFFTDGDMFAYENDDSNVQILKDGKAFGYNADNAHPYEVLFVSGAGATTYDKLLQTSISSCKTAETITGEEITAASVDGDTLSFSTELPASTAAKAGLELGDDVDDAKVRVDYTADKNTWEVQKSSAYLVRADGTEILVQEQINEYDGSYTISDELTGLQSSSKNRTVTIVADPGTPEEASYSITVNKGVAVYYMLPHDYNGIYMDQACTETITEEASNDYDSDLTLYIANGM